MKPHVARLECVVAKERFVVVDNEVAVGVTERREEDKRMAVRTLILIEAMMTGRARGGTE